MLVNRIRLNQLSSGSGGGLFVSIKLFKMNKETASCSHVTPEPPQGRAVTGRGRRSTTSTEMFSVGDDVLWQDRATKNDKQVTRARARGLFVHARDGPGGASAEKLKQTPAWELAEQNSDGRQQQQPGGDGSMLRYVLVSIWSKSPTSLGCH